MSDDLNLGHYGDLCDAAESANAAYVLAARNLIDRVKVAEARVLSLEAVLRKASEYLDTCPPDDWESHARWVEVTLVIDAAFAAAGKPEDRHE